MPTPKKSLNELLTDDEEARDLLQLYGIEAPDKEQTKQHLDQLIAQIGEGQLLASLFELASSLALMAQEIFDLALEAGVGIQGQVQFPTERTPLALSALDSGWAFSSASPMNTDVNERAQALISRLSAIVDDLDPKQLIKKAEETYETELGRALSQRTDLQAQALRSALPVEETNDFEAFSEADKRGVSSALNALHQAQSHLSGIHLPSGVKATFDELERRCQVILDAMAKAEGQDGEAANPTISALADEIQMVSMRLRELAEETSEAVRAEGGFRDFLKSDFWFQRWRIYELWVLSRVLRTLQRVDGRITLRRVINGVWQLKYGRDYEPIATCEIGGRHLDFYYQLYREDRDATELPDEKVADMPDIAVFERVCESNTDIDSKSAFFGRAVAVIDPKHGLSFNYKKVDEVLRRYAQQFQPALTAVVNYYPMRAYPFNLSILHEKRLILASGVAPGSVSLRRLELSLEDTLLSLNLVSPNPIAEPPKIKPLRRRAETGVLLYIATRTIEVDEPEGLWILSERGGVVPVPEGLKVVDEVIQAIHSTADGAVCVLETSKQLVWLVEKRKPRVINKPDNLHRSIGWNPHGVYFAATSGDGLCFWTRDGSERDLIPISGGIKYDDNAVWDPIGDAVILQVHGGYSSPTRLMRFDLSGHQTLLYEASQKDFLNTYLTVITLGQKERALINSSLGSLLLTNAGVQQWEESEAPLAASPSDAYRIFDGPRSKHWKEDVQLLRLETSSAQTKPLPLVRFRGRLGSAIRWSFDESRFAFLVSRDDADGTRMKTLMYARLGDRYAEAVSLPGQDPQIFGWVMRSLLESITK